MNCRAVSSFSSTSHPLKQDLHILRETATQLHRTDTVSTWQAAADEYLPTFILQELQTERSNCRDFRSKPERLNSTKQNMHKLGLNQHRDIIAHILTKTRSRQQKLKNFVSQTYNCTMTLHVSLDQTVFNCKSLVIFILHSPVWGIIIINGKTNNSNDDNSTSITQRIFFLCGMHH